MRMQIKAYRPHILLTNKCFSWTVLAVGSQCLSCIFRHVKALYQGTATLACWLVNHTTFFFFLIDQC